MEKGITYLYDLNGKEGWLLTRNHTSSAIGENRHLGDTNQSSLHKDFICKNASVFIDSKQVMNQGKLS